MLATQITTYRQIVTLKDGVNILLRPMTPDDEQALINLFSPISDEDLRYLHDNVRDPTTIQEWCDHLDFKRVLPLMALVNERAVGQASLHLQKGPARHMAKVRIFLAQDFRRRGLGTKMLNTLIELARKQDLHMLVAEVVADQSKVIKAFQSLGFQLRCTFEDYFMLPNGETRDVAVLVLPLKMNIDEF
ncbi:MAG: GNAT family N-acetyltransferase [Chloroflexi bacterium]|nr:MAG: GNAT family N-acetyltransferase [Chloroflexota bacterium]